MITAVALVVAVVAAVRSLWSPCGLSMLTSITPFAERSRGHRYPITAAWFVLGAVIGGLGLGLVSAVGAGLLGLLHLPSAVLGGTAVAVALLTAAADLGLYRLPVHPRQVNETWLGKYRRWVYAAGFGVQIGSGFTTYIMTSAVYLTAALAVLTAQPVPAVLICLTFGVVRGLAVLIGGFARTPELLRTLLARIQHLAGTSLVAAAGVQVWAVAALVGGLVGSAVPALVAAVIVVATVIIRARRPAPTAPEVATVR